MTPRPLQAEAHCQLSVEGRLTSAFVHMLCGSHHMYAGWLVQHQAGPSKLLMLVQQCALVCKVTMARCSLTD